MDRRLALAALAAAAAVPLAGPASAQSGGPAQRPKDLNVRHIEDTMQVGTVALATSRMALEKARDPRVKQFAQFEIAEQETVAAVLKAMQEPDTTATTQDTGGANGQPGQVGTSSRMADSNAQPSLGPHGGPMVDKMQDLSGAEFDRAYVKAQLEGHKQLLQIQDAALQSGGPREQLGIARMARTQISEHIVLLQALDQAISRG